MLLMLCLSWLRPAMSQNRVVKKKDDMPDELSFMGKKV
jgi:hypothetical protein